MPSKTAATRKTTTAKRGKASTRKTSTARKTTTARKTSGTNSRGNPTRIALGALDKKLAALKQADPKATIKRHPSGAASIRYLQPWQKGWRKGGAAKPTAADDQHRYCYAILPDGRQIGYTFKALDNLTPADRKLYADALATITRPDATTKAKAQANGKTTRKAQAKASTTRAKAKSTPAKRDPHTPPTFADAAIASANAKEAARAATTADAAAA